MQPSMTTKGMKQTYCAAPWLAPPQAGTVRSRAPAHVPKSAINATIPMMVMLRTGVSRVMAVLRSLIRRRIERATIAAPPADLNRVSRSDVYLTGGVWNLDQKIAAPRNPQSSPGMITVVDQLLDSRHEDVFALPFGGVKDHPLGSDRERDA